MQLLWNYEWIVNPRKVLWKKICLFTPREEKIKSSDFYRQIKIRICTFTISYLLQTPIFKLIFDKNNPKPKDIFIWVLNETYKLDTLLHLKKSISFLQIRD